MSELRFGLHPHRIRLEGDLVVGSPLHLGSGDVDTSLLPVAEGNDQAPGVATLQRDGAGRPVLVGPSVKGLLRRLCPEQVAQTLFGEIRRNDTGQLGCVFVWGAALQQAGDPGDAPYVAALAPERPGTFIAARTRIDPATGTADHNKLFFQEYVPAGARFRLRLLLVADDPASRDQRWQELLAVLARLVDRPGGGGANQPQAPRIGGATLGRGQADGQGFLTLDWATLAATRLDLGADGAWRTQPLKPALPATATVGPGLRTHWTIALHCRGPFVIVDSSHTLSGSEDERNRQRQLNRNAPALAQLKAQRSALEQPLVLGSSITGALRARAAWLQAKVRPEASDARDEVCHGGTDVSALSPVERLFGVTGFRALLTLEALRVPKATPWTVTSVKLDRFSGAPFDTGLFNTATFVGVSVSFRLCLNHRDGLSADAGHHYGAADLARDLVKDLEDNGLMLGHGTNKGFGWFECVRLAAGG